MKRPYNYNRILPYVGLMDDSGLILLTYLYFEMTEA